jgi:hypothetical protein
MSYFKSNSVPILSYSKDFLTNVSYQELPTTYNHTMISKRNKYTTKINNWLNQPFLLSDGYQYEDTNGNEIFPDLEYSQTHDIENISPDEFSENYDIHLKRNSSVCLFIYKEIMEAINESSYELIDEKQFKEDFIHYIYTISDTNKIYYNE